MIFEIKSLLQKLQTRHSLFFLLVLIAILLRLYKLETLFNFDYDQAVQAEYAHQLLVNHKFAIIGQELSFQGFFLGPVHSVVEAVPYFLCKLRPDCTPYFFALTGLSTGIIFYLLFRNILGAKVAFMAVYVYLISYAQIRHEFGVNSNNLIIPAAVLALFCLFKYFEYRDKFLVLGSFLLGLAVVNFNPVVVFFAVAYFVTALLRHGRSFLTYTSSICAFLVNFVPLIIFNARHENLLFTNFLKFIKDSSQPHDYLFTFGALVWDNLLPFYLDYLAIPANIITKLGMILILVLGLILLKKNLKNQKVFYLFPLIFLFYLLGFTLYSSHVPPYYFTATLPVFLILLSSIVTRYKLALLIFLVVFPAANVQAITKFDSRTNYHYKKQAVRFIIEDSKDKPFMLYNDMPIGANTGYNTLFKLFGKEPKEEEELLYIMDLLSDKRIEVKPLQYKWIYKEKNVLQRDFGSIRVTAVKPE